MEKLFDKLFATKSDGETPVVARSQALPAFNQLYHVLYSKQVDKRTALAISLTKTLDYLNTDVVTYKKVLGKIIDSTIRHEPPHVDNDNDVT